MPCYGRNITFPRQQQQQFCRGSRQELLPSVSELDGTPFRLPCLDLETNSCSDGHLSDIMPDVASSTVASSAIVSMGQLQLEDAAPESLQLDLGDRPGHMTCGGPSGIDLRNPQVSCFIF